MLLANLRKVLESEALSREELVGFIVALFIEEDGRLSNVAIAAEARALLARLRPRDPMTRLIWDCATDRLKEIYNTPSR
jgi:hypothetical protein